VSREKLLAVVHHDRILTGRVDPHKHLGHAGERSPASPFRLARCDTPAGVTPPAPVAGEPETELLALLLSLLGSRQLYARFKHEEVPASCWHQDAPVGRHCRRNAFLRPVPPQRGPILKPQSDHKTSRRTEDEPFAGEGAPKGLSAIRSDG
jgi:hypothetical protein